jgi:mannosyltransferase
MAAGVPGVSTDVGGVKDVISSDAIGARVPDGDAAGLAAALEQYLADRDARRAAGQRARAAVVNRYSLDRLVADINALYRELLAR